MLKSFLSGFLYRQAQIDTICNYSNPTFIKFTLVLMHVHSILLFSDTFLDFWVYVTIKANVRDMVCAIIAINIIKSSFHRLLMSSSCPSMATLS